MAVFVNHAAAEVANLQLLRSRALDQIDCALDQGDRRAFRTWCKRYDSVAARITRLLVKMVTTSDAT